MEIKTRQTGESPEFLRVSLSSAMWLNLKNGKFWRGARSPCVNLLLTYESGCAANCAFCGLARKREGKYTEKSFIHVSWEPYRTEEIYKRIRQYRHRIERVCFSMITNRRCVADTKELVQALRGRSDVPISILAAPTVIKLADIRDFRVAGADMLGIAIDAATDELFGKLRGSGVKGPHKVETYWRRVEESIEIFTPTHTGVHFIVGLGETEKQSLSAIQKVRDLGASTHLFSFLAEPNSAMATVPQPPIGKYRRVQLGRFLIDNDISKFGEMRFDRAGRVSDFGIPDTELESVIGEGRAFLTSGCPGENGEVACNRPYANTILPQIRNYPFKPDADDITRIRQELRI